MGFLIFTLLLLPAMALYALADAALRPFSGILGPVLAWLNDPAVFYAAVRVLLVWNVLVLAALLLVRRRMKRTRGPGWEWEYIHQAQGWRRRGRRLICLVLLLGLYAGLFWVLLCTVLLVTQIAGPMP
ncbi:hypothetical protein AALA82_03810 [Oscillospiraceae bacterium 50-16]|nr:hypothetical protein [Lawsonibacter sp.]